MDDSKLIRPDGHQGCGAIPKLVLLQILGDGQGNRRGAILAKMLRNEITRERAICLMHPGLVISGVLMLLLLLLLLRPT